MSTVGSKALVSSGFAFAVATTGLYCATRVWGRGVGCYAGVAGEYHEKKSGKGSVCLQLSSLQLGFMLLGGYSLTNKFVVM